MDPHLLLLGSVLMSVAQVTTNGQVDVFALPCHQRPCRYLRAMRPLEGAEGVACAVSEVMGTSGSMLLPGAMCGPVVLGQPGFVLVSQAFVTTKGSADVPGLNCHPRDCAKLVSLLTSLRVVWERCLSCPLAACADRRAGPAPHLGCTVEEFP